MLSSNNYETESGAAFVRAEGRTGEPRLGRVAWYAGGAILLSLIFWALFQEAPRALRWPLRLAMMATLVVATVCALRIICVGPLRLRPLFSNGVRTDPLLIGLFVALHLVLLNNALFHHPMATYDSKPHREVAHLWSRLDVPTREATRGIHYAPLGYAPTSVLLLLGTPEREAMKVTQLVNVVYSMVLVCFLLRLARLVSPSDLLLRRLLLAVLVCFPVYYKSFAMARPEPMLAMWCVLATYYATRIFCLGEREYGLFTLFGLFTSAMLLTRQWGGFLLPAFGVAFLLSCWWYPDRVAKLARGLTLSVGLCLLVAGWYYAIMTQVHGTPMAFDSVLRPFSFANWEPAFFWDFFPPGLFTAPVKALLDNRFFALLHAETWGDYWGMWLFDCIPGQLMPEGYLDTAAPMLPLLRVSVPVALGGTLLLVVGVLGSLATIVFAFSRSSTAANRATTLPPLLVLFTAGFYFVFVVCYTNTASIRATYILQIFPFAAFCLGFFLWRLSQHSKIAFQLTTLIWFIIGLVQVPTFVTRIAEPRDATVLLERIPLEISLAIFVGFGLGILIMLRESSQRQKSLQANAPTATDKSDLFEAQNVAAH